MLVALLEEIFVYIFCYLTLLISKETVVQYKISKTKLKEGEFTFSDIFFLSYISAIMAFFLNHFSPLAI